MCKSRHELTVELTRDVGERYLSSNQEQVFQVEDLMLLRDEGMLQTVFSKHVTRRKVEMALDRPALQASGQ